MADVGDHFANLWFAGTAENWPLADFYLNETKSHLRWAVRRIPIRKDNKGREINLTVILEAFENSQLAQLKRTIDGKDEAGLREDLQGEFDRVLLLPPAADKPYLRPRVPGQPQSRIINFDPKADWPLCHAREQSTGRLRPSPGSGSDEPARTDRTPAPPGRSRTEPMNPIVFALRRPYTVMVAVIAVAMGSGLALSRMSIDIFPNLNLPVVYVCQPYGGMDPAQMEGLLTNYYEYHFLYINGIHHVESRNIQGMALMKLSFQPGTNMAQAMAEVIGYVTRSRAFMPPGTVSPFITRFDAGSVPVGYLVLSSETKSIGEIQDQALFKVRPMFAGLPGVSAPPPFGGSQRTVVVRVDPDRLRAYRMSPDEVTRRWPPATRSAPRARSASAS